MKYEIYTDGSSRGNPGKGGWGCIVMNEDKAREYSGSSNLATNNQMEMYAVEHALSLINSICVPKDKVVINSDSQYTIKGLTEWVDGWEKNNWKNSQKKDVLNKDSWVKMLELKRSIKDKKIDLSLKYVKAHNGHKYNERVDKLATSAALKEDIDLYNGKIGDYDKVVMF
jgi:ribonuclease HI